MCFRYAHMPWWESPPGYHPRYTTNSQRLRSIDFKTMPSMPGNTLLSPPSNYLEPAGPYLGSRAIGPYGTATYTNAETTAAPETVEVTDGMRMQARAIIWGDVEGAEEWHGSGNFTSNQREKICSEALGCCPPNRRQRVRARIERKLHTVYGKLEKRVEKVEHIAFRRTYLRAKRVVKRIKPLKKFIQGVARSAKGLDVFTETQWNASTASLARSVATEPERFRRPSKSRTIKQRASNYSAYPFIEPATPEPGVPILSYPGAAAGAASTESFYTWTRGDDITEGDVQALLARFHRHTAEQMANSTGFASSAILPLGRSTSISAQIATFQFSTLVPMDTLRGFDATYRVMLKTGNTVLAQNDLMQLSHIWNQVMESAPSPVWLRTCQPLRVLSDYDAEKLCKLMEESLHRYAFWAFLTEISVTQNEGAVDIKWWSEFEDKLDSIGYPDDKTLYEQLVVVGSEYINVDALATVMALAAALDVASRSDRVSVIQDVGTEAADEENELLFLTDQEEAITPEIAEDIPVQRFETSSLLVPQSSRAEVSLPVLRDEVEQEIIAPLRILRSEKKISASVEEPGESTSFQPAVNKSIHHEEVILRAACNSPLPNEEPSSTDIASSSSDIMGELQASLDAAIGELVTLPEPVMQRNPSPLPRALETRKSRPMLAKRESTDGKPALQKRRDSPQEEPISPPITRENGWISAENLKDFRPEDVLHDIALNEKTSRMSEKARGKLPVSRSSKRPISFAAARRSSSRQGSSGATPARRISARGASVQTTRKPLSLPVKAKAESNISRLPQRPNVVGTVVQDAAPRPSAHRSKDENCESETTRETSRVITPATVARLSSTRNAPVAFAGSRQSNIPVRDRSTRLYMPGTYPTETTDDEAQE
ncbi:hypothetical protein EJ07DRAFT_156260 [Lizonia empirigonia]|nr:hypothetical protein EJ07DRAFT_156260 [Lizonia empirigonia]